MKKLMKMMECISKTIKFNYNNGVFGVFRCGGFCKMVGSLCSMGYAHRYHISTFQGLVTLLQKHLI
jgi:hypothetical protein